MPAKHSSIAVWRVARVLGDLLAGLLALGLTFVLRVSFPLPFTESLLPADRLAYFGIAGMVVAFTQNTLLYFFGFYELPRPGQRAERVRRLFFASSLQGLILMGFYFLTSRPFPRSVVILFVPFNLALLVAVRMLLDRGLEPPQRRAVIAGCGPRAQELADDIDRYHWHGVAIVGHVSTPDDATSEGPGELLGSIDDVPRLIAQGVVDDVILTGDFDNWQTALIDRLARRPDARSSLLLLPGPFDSLLGRMRYRSIHDIPLIEVVRESEWHARRPLKRALDLILAGVLLVVTAPLFLLCAAAILLTAGRPVLYSQQRIGRDRRPFVLWKLRTMRRDAEGSGEEILAAPGDPRLIRLGSLLRTLRLDELPQLFNVLNGTMSMVGPRPERPGFVRRYLEGVPGYAARFSIQPGLTGLAQVNGDYHSSAENKLRYDLAYLANWSVWLDLTILIRTVRIVLTSRGV